MYWSPGRWPELISPTQPVEAPLIAAMGLKFAVVGRSLLGACQAKIWSPETAKLNSALDSPVKNPKLAVPLLVLAALLVLSMLTWMIFPAGRAAVAVQVITPFSPLVEKPRPVRQPASVKRMAVPASISVSRTNAKRSGESRLIILRRRYRLLRGSSARPPC